MESLEKSNQDLNDGDVIGHKVEGLVRKLEKPILIVTEDFKEPESLCLAYDGSEGAVKALEFLIDSEVAGNLKVHVVYVGEETDKTNAMLKSAEEKLEKASLSVETRILNGEIEDTLKEYLNLNEISILAMGAFGHNWFHDLLMGSLTSKMIRIIKRPLLVLR